MPSLRSRAPIAALRSGVAGTAALLAFAAPGLAATKTVLPTDIDALPRGGTVEAGTASLTIAGGAKARLTSAGVKITAGGSADVKGSKLGFQAAEKNSLVDVTEMVGAVPVEGSITFKGAKGSAKLTEITFQPGGERNVTAKLGKKLIELGSLKGGKSTFSRQADGSLKGAKLSLTSRGVKAINAKTGGGLATGSFGTVAIKVIGRELPLKQGTATLTVNPDLIKLLTDNGFDLVATPPSTRAGNIITIPLTAGAFDPEGLTGRLSLDGKLTITGTVAGAQRNIDLFGFRAVVSATQKDLYANINDSVAGILATVDVSTLESQFEGANFTAKGGKLALTKIAVGILKNSSGIALPVGTPLGTVDLTGQISGQ